MNPSATLAPPIVDSQTTVQKPEQASPPNRVPLRIDRFFSSPHQHPYETVTWEFRSAAITDERGRTIFAQEAIEVPEPWSDLATRILASKYFYGDIEKGTDPASGGRESSLKQVLDRVCKTIAHWGLQDGYFEDESTARVFEEELTALCLNQHGAFNSPVWFNVGLDQAYQIESAASRGNFRWDSQAKAPVPVPNPYRYPQSSACFIQGVEDNLDSIMKLAEAEALLFKFGSGSGTDLSSIRSSREKLSGGGRPSGPLSFLAVYDAVAGVVKSGGKTRRAAKMNTLKDWHPDIGEFIAAKPAEEQKAWALIEQGYDPSFNGEAYGSIKFQNENLSVRASDAFMRAASGETDPVWWTRRVTDGQPCEEKNAPKLLRQIAEATHLCGDPGMQFDDTIHHWHTCKESGRQNCSNPCSEYLFLDHSACNLASINLLSFPSPDGFDSKAFAQACRIFIIAQDILIDRSSYPTKPVTYNAHKFRPLGLGYANLGGLLMANGLAYDSDEGRALAAAITALMTGTAYQTSAELAALLGAFEGYHDPAVYGQTPAPAANNHASMHEVIEQHLPAVEQIDPTCPPALREAAQAAWENARSQGLAHGYRNAQVTALAPTGTIGFLMDCDTTGIEPAIGLIAYKQLSGGGCLTLPLQTVPVALERMGYSPQAVQSALAHLEKYGTLEDLETSQTVLRSGIRSEHLAVFDTAFRSGSGTRSLSPSAHLEMVAAVQPFLSGGVSKTVNVPEETTVEQIRDIYIRAWKLGIKGVAIYRDGSKRSAPVSTRKQPEEKPREVQILTEPYRRKLPDTRASVTHHFSIGGSEGYLTVGRYDDGSPGEVFLQMAKAGSTINGLMDTIGILLSLSLQYGVPLETLVRKFSHVRFEPEGITRNPEIPFAKSVVDYLARFLGMEFVPGYREEMSPVPTSESSLEDRAPHATSIENAAERNRPIPSVQMRLLTESTGNTACPECGSFRVKVTGSCATCLNCGSSLGCS